jgi:hypothetical protein
MKCVDTTVHAEISQLEPVDWDYVHDKIYGDEYKTNLKKTYRFAEGLKRNIPRSVIMYERTYYGRLFLCFPGDIHTAFMIDSTLEGGSRFYAVFAGHIENNKFSHGRNTKRTGSKDMARAIRAAKKNLRRVPLDQSLHTIAYFAKDPLRTAYTQLQSEWRNARRDALGNPSQELELEVMNLYKAGHTFINNDLNVRINTMVEAQKTLEAEKEIQSGEGDRRWFAVHTTNHEEDGDIIIYAEMYVEGEPASWSRTFDIAKTAQWRSPQMVPVELLGRLAMMQMVSVDHYTPGIGVRVSESNYMLSVPWPMTEPEKPHDMSTLQIPSMVSEG